MSVERALPYFSLLAVRGVRRSDVWKLIEALRLTGRSMDEALRDPIDEDYLGRYFGRDQLLDLSWTRKKIEREITDAGKEDVRFVDALENEYPERLRDVLGDDAPPVLAYMGDLSLINQATVGFCGSRNASTRRIEVASDCARQVANLGVVTVSGNARGVDVATHEATLEAGGRSIFILPEGILRFRIRKSLRGQWDWERILVISEYFPNMRWTTYGAMRRNKTIIAASDIMVVIEAGQNGGTMDAGIRALKLGRTLYAAVYEEMPRVAVGNAVLIERGAKPLMKSRGSGRASLKALLKDLSRLREQSNVMETQRELGI